MWKTPKLCAGRHLASHHSSLSYSNTMFQKPKPLTAECWASLNMWKLTTGTNTRKPLLWGSEARDGNTRIKKGCKNKSPGNQKVVGYLNTPSPDWCWKTDTTRYCNRKLRHGSITWNQIVSQRLILTSWQTQKSAFPSSLLKDGFDDLCRKDIYFAN